MWRGRLLANAKIPPNLCPAGISTDKMSATSEKELRSKDASGCPMAPMTPMPSRPGRVPA